MLSSIRRVSDKVTVAVIAGLVGVLVAAMLGSIGFGAAQDGQTTDTNYIAVDPYRALDTRRTNSPTGGAPFGPRQVFALRVAGVGAVPQDAVAVQANITATEPSMDGHLRVWPEGERPNVSSLNWAVGQTVPNLVTMRLGGDGAFRMYNNTGTVHVIVDIVGYYVDDVDPVVPEVEFAVVRANGVAQRVTGGVEFTTRVGVGQYIVDFDRDVSSCAYQASYGSATTQDSTAVPGLADLVVGVATNAGNADQVYVEIDDASAGTESVDSDFHLTVTC